MLFNGREISAIVAIVFAALICVFLFTAPKKHKDAVVNQATQSTGRFLKAVIGVVAFAQTGSAVYGVLELVVRLPMIAFAILGEYFVYSLSNPWENGGWGWMALLVVLDILAIYNILHSPLSAIGSALGNTVLIQLQQFNQSAQQTAALQQIAKQTAIPVEPVEPVIATLLAQNNALLEQLVTKPESKEPETPKT